MHIKNDAKGLIVVFAAALFLQPATAQNTTFEKADHGVIVYSANNNLNSTRAVQLEVVSDKIIHVIESPELPLQSDTSLMVIPQNFGVKYSVNSSANDITVSTSMIRAIVSKKSGLVTFKDLEGKDLLSEDDNVKSFTPVAIDAGRSWQIQRSFIATGDAAFYGLGQHQQGTMNYRGNVITLLQNNTEVAIPFLVSNKNYGLLWDNYSISKFTDGRQYESLDQLKLYDADNNAGALSASYVSKNDPQQVTTKRDEKIIAYDYLSDQKDFPSAFPLDKGKVIWIGSIESPFSGVHTFAFRYGGYIKAWINDSLCLDEWRQCWNPKTTFIPFAIQAGQKYAFRMEWIPDGGESYISCNWLRPATAEENKHFILQSEAGDNVNYYFVYGKNADEIIAGYRRLTGKAPIVPEWALGFWQSRERYKTQEQVVSTVQAFRKTGVPLDNIVLDWQYWRPDQWGSQQFDSSRFPDPKGMIDSLHNLYHAHIMVSVWPKFYKDIPNYNLMNKQGFLYTKNIELNRKDWLGYVSTFYDAFNPKAAKAFWGLVDKNLYRLGVDAFWMDASEPDIHSNLSVEHKKELMFPNALGSATKYFNAYPLVNAKAIFEGERSVTPDKRVFILTRSAYGGSQRYGASVWSGDIGSRWDDMKNQISAGVNFSMSGIPYWTMDIGGFAVEHRYENATGDNLKEWQELMTRWYQFGSFCPLFRVHGQFPFREIFNVSSPGEPAYESMLYYDKLRYRLMSYIYSLAAKTYFDDYTMMRGLLMDFPADKNVTEINDQFMFGNSLLVNPVYKMNADSRKVYLPAGNGWYDLYSGKYFDGGETIKADAPYQRIPVFVKEGSIVPFGPALQYTGEKKADTISLFIYTGKNAFFTLYEDDDTSYNYQQGKYATVTFNYNEASKQLTIGKHQGKYVGMLKSKVFNICWITKDRPADLNFERKYNRRVIYHGNQMVIGIK